jgi:hypothetical protein
MFWPLCKQNKSKKSTGGSTNSTEIIKVLVTRTYPPSSLPIVEYQDGRDALMPCLLVAISDKNRRLAM